MTNWAKHETNHYIMPSGWMLLTFSFLLLVPVAYMAFVAAMPKVPHIIFNLSNRAETMLVVAYLLVPLPMFIIAFCTERLKGWRLPTSGIAVLLCTIAAGVYGFWRGGVGDDYRNPECHLKSVVIANGNYELKQYETITGSYLNEETRILPFISISREVFYTPNELEVRPLSATQVDCITRLGHEVVSITGG